MSQRREMYLHDQAVTAYRRWVRLTSSHTDRSVAVAVGMPLDCRRHQLLMHHVNQHDYNILTASLYGVMAPIETGECNYNSYGK